jgi:hypothetical protein
VIQCGVVVLDCLCAVGGRGAGSDAHACASGDADSECGSESTGDRSAHRRHLQRRAVAENTVTRQWGRVVIAQTVDVG